MSDRHCKRGRHQALDKDLTKSIRWLEQNPNVTKIIVGLSRGCFHRIRHGTLRYVSKEHDKIKLYGYGNRGVTRYTVTVKMEKMDEVIKAIQDKFK